MAEDQVREWVDLKLENGIDPHRIKQALEDMDKDPEIVDKVRNDGLEEHPSVISESTGEDDTQSTNTHSIIERNKPEEITEIEEMPRDIQLSTSPLDDAPKTQDPFDGSAAVNTGKEESENKKSKSGSSGSEGSSEETHVIDIPGVDKFEVSDYHIKIAFSIANTLIVGAVLYYLFA